MALIHLIAFLAEFALVVFLMLGALGPGGWWIIGLVAYFVISVAIGNNPLLVGIGAFLVALVLK